MSDRRWILWSLRLGGGVAVALILCAAGLFVLLQTRPGLDFLARGLGRELSDDTVTVRVSGLQADLPSGLRMVSVTAADRDGVFATARDIRLVWRPAALFGRTLAIQSATVGTVAVSRLPQGYGSSGGSALQDLIPGVNLRIGSLSVGEIALAPPVLGAAQRIAATGAARLDTDLSTAALDLVLRRLDGRQDVARIGFDYSAHPAHFDAKVHVEEPSGGILSRLAGLPRGQRLFIDLSGSGPPDAWRGALKVEAGAATSATADVAIKLSDGRLDVTTSGTANVEGLAPRALHPLFTRSVRFRAAAGLSQSDGLSVRRFTAETDSLTVDGTVRYPARDRGFSATLAVRTRGAHPLEGIAPGLSIDTAKIDAKIDGAMNAPHVALSFRAGRIARSGLRLAALTGSVDVTPASATVFDLKGTAKAEGVDPGASVPAGLLGRTLDLTFAGTVARDGSMPRLTVSVTSGSAGIELSGELDRKGAGAGTYALRLDRIQPAARAAGLAVKGSLRAEGTFRADLTARTARASVNGVLAELAGPAPGVAAALGSRIPVTGTVEWRDGSPLKVVGLELRLAIGRLAADGTVDINTGHVSAKVTAIVPTLVPLSRLAGTRLAGRATASGSLAGPMSDLTARGAATIEDLRVAQTAVGRISVDYTAHHQGSGLMAALRLGGNIRGKRLDGRLTAGIRGDRIGLSGVDLGLGRNRIIGSASVETRRKRLSGALTATLSDLADLPGADRYPVAGAAEVRVAAAAETGQDLDIIASAHDLRIGDVAAVGHATARFRVGTPFGHATAAGDVDIGDLSAAGLQRARATIRLRGDASRIGWSATAAADRPYAASLSADGDLTLAAARSRLSVEKLQGKIASQPLALRSPFAVSWQGAAWQVEPIDLALAGGRVRLAGSFAGSALDATGRIDALPLRLAALIDPRFGLDGAVDGTLQASGAARRVVLSASFTAHGIRPLETAKDEFPGFNAKLELHQDGSAFRVDAKFTGPNDTSITGRLQTRPVIALAPPSLAFDRALPLAGEITATGRLGLVDQLVGLGEDRLGGRITGRAKIAGTLGNPDVRGEMRLQDGLYEGAETGSVLRHIDARMTFDGDSVRLVSLTADDGASGRLSGHGTVKLSGAAAGSEGIQVQLKQFAVLRHPLADIVASGELDLSGSVQAPTLAGRLRVDRGDIRIPDKLPVEVVDLDVVEINGKGPQAARSPAVREPSLARVVPVALDLTLAFPGRTFVRGRGLESEWKGNLVISGTTRAPVIKGKLEAVRGIFAFAGKTFTVQSGSVFFPSAPNAEPEIEAIAQAKLTDLVAQVTISGNVSKPKISISSDPVMPQEDVLARILFGRTTGQLSAIQAAQLAQTAATLSGTGGGTAIIDKVRQALGIDVLNVESQEGDSKGASLKAGKYLTDEMFLSVTQGTTAGSQKIGVEVQVMPNVTVESDISGDASGNIGLNWKWDY